MSYYCTKCMTFYSGEVVCVHKAKVDNLVRVDKMFGTYADREPLRDGDSVMEIRHHGVVVFEVKGNGDIFIQGELVRNDKRVAVALWESQPWRGK